jgi:hypothetical protein
MLKLMDRNRLDYPEKTLIQTDKVADLSDGTYGKNPETSGPIQDPFPACTEAILRQQIDNSRRKGFRKVGKVKR